MTKILDKLYCKKRDIHQSNVSEKFRFNTVDTWGQLILCLVEFNGKEFSSLVYVGGKGFIMSWLGDEWWLGRLLLSGVDMECRGWKQTLRRVIFKL